MTPLQEQYLYLYNYNLLFNIINVITVTFH